VKIAEALKSNVLNLRIDFGTRRLIGNDAGDGFEVYDRPRYTRHITVLYTGNDEDAAAAAAALLGEDAEA